MGMSRRLIAILPLPLLLSVGCGDEALAPHGHGDPAGPAALAFGIGTTPGFSDWITEPTVFSDPIQEIPDPDGVLPPIRLLRSGFAGGVYGFDSNDDGVFDVELTAALEVISTVTPLADGTFEYQWSFANLGSGAVVGFVAESPCGLTAPDFGISPESALLGTAGPDRIPGTGDDLGDGQTLERSLISGADLVFCGYDVPLNPTVTGVEIVVPQLASPATKDDCKDEGWQDFGFENQGQCVRFVETGKDSRLGE